MTFTVPSNDAPELSIVVLFTHDPELARRCIGSIEAVIDELPPCESIFLLGGSSDAVREVIAEARGARVIDSPTNIGTAVGWQLGFNAARGKHVLLMHEDAAATPGMVAGLIETIESDPAAAVVAPWLVERGEGVPTNCGWVWFRDQSQTRLTSDHIPQELLGAPYAVDGVSSAIAIWDRASWLEGGGFDERNFPALGVDADACTSAWARGRSVLIDPRLRGIHRTGAMDDAPTRLSGKFVRYPLLDRYKRLWFEKWGAMSSWYPELPAGVERDAVETSMLLAVQDRRRERPQIAGTFPRAEHPFTDPNREGLTPVNVDSELVERLRVAELEVMDKYHYWLIEHSEAQHAEIEHLNEFIKREIGPLAEFHAAVVDGRYWKLRTRLRRLLRMEG